MPSWNIHIAQAERLLARDGACARFVRDANAFLFGNLVPDIPVVAFELHLEALLRASGDQEAYREFSQFPSVEHDLAIVVDDDVTCEDLERRLRSAGGKLLVGVRLFDVYRDPVRVGVGKKSMAFALTYRAEDHTLTSEEVERAHQKLVTKVCKATGGEVRS